MRDVFGIVSNDYLASVPYFTLYSSEASSTGLSLHFVLTRFEEGAILMRDDDLGVSNDLRDRVPPLPCSVIFIGRGG